MGKRNKIVAGITGAAALIAAPFIHNAFSLAAEANGDDSPSNVSITTNEVTPAPTTNSSSNGDADNGEKDQDAMPVSVNAEISNGQATVTVNGVKTVVPEGGSINKTVNDDSSTTTINIKNEDGNISTNTNTTSGRTRINSRTSSSVNVTTKTSDKEVIH